MGLPRPCLFFPVHGCRRRMDGCSGLFTPSLPREALERHRLPMNRLPVFRMLVAAWIFQTACAVSAASGALVPVDLRCEYARNPLGIDVPEPRLSWRLASTASDARGQHQTAYEISAASTTESLLSAAPDLWNSGKVSWPECTHIKYPGRGLTSLKTVWWRVRVADEQGHWSGWSSPATWTMGLLDPTDWGARWIGLEELPEEKPRPAAESMLGLSWYWLTGSRARADVPAGAVEFRREFQLPGEVPLRGATAVFAADDTFTLLVNGSKAGAGSSFGVFGRFDVLSKLQPGINTIEVRATNGIDSPAGLTGKVILDWSDGVTSTIAVDESWQVRPALLSDAQEENGAKAAPWTGPQAVARVGEAPWGIPQPPTEAPPMAARMLRREFTLHKPVRRALVSVSGLGMFDLFLNGQQVGDHCMDPALTQYDHRVMYVTFDVSDRLREGANALGVVLGNGRFRAPRLDIPVPTRSWGVPRLLLQADIEFQDGSTTRIVSNETWKATAEGPIRANNEYDGEEYDARREMTGWTEPRYRDGAWAQARLLPAPPGKLSAQPLEPMRVTERIRPVRVRQVPGGTCLVDMGQAFYGSYRMRFQGERGTTVTIRSAYSLNPDGTLRAADNRSARCTDVYVLRGGEVEEWSPRFKGQGYRYLEVTGYPGTLDASSCEGLVIHTDVETAGEFECSDELVNRIWHNVRWGQRSFMRSVLLDPDRDERQGWLGDPARGVEAMAFNFQVPRFFSKWMGDIRADQRQDGLIQDVVPTYWTMASGDVVWPSVAVLVPETLYDFYGDRRVLEENYPAMKRWMEFQEARLQPDFTAGAGPYGDWCDTSGTDTGATSSSLISTAYFANNCRVMARVARVLGREEEACHYTRLRQKVAQGLNSRFFEPGKATYTGGSQCSNLLPLVFDLVPEDHRHAVLSTLVEDIRVRHRGHASVGLVGMQWLMQGLADLGCPDVAWTIATRTDYPGWGYMISKGATTIWEHWDTDRQDPGMNSENLLILAGNVTGWMYRTVAGINPDPMQPGFKNVIIRPRPVEGLAWARAYHRTLRGKVRAEWRIADGRFHLEVTLPPNTTATIDLPDGVQGEVLESGRPAAFADGVQITDGSCFQIQSGKYVFTAGWKP